MTIEQLVDKHFDQLFNEIIKIEADDFDDILIEVVTLTTGKTIRRSWRDRNQILRDKNDD